MAELEEAIDSNDIKYAIKPEILMMDFQKYEAKSKGRFSREWVFPAGSEIIPLVSSVHGSSLAHLLYLSTFLVHVLKNLLLLQ